jgi:hypothetical protein
MRKYFIVVGALLNFGVLFTILFAFQYILASGLSLPVFSEKVTEKISVNQPNLYKIAAPFLNALSYFAVENKYFRQIDLQHWSGIGASVTNSTKFPQKLATLTSRYQTVNVSNEKELKKALASAKAGQTIVIAPGEYYFSSYRVIPKGIGTSVNPIRLTAAKLGTVKIFLKGEGFFVQDPYWQFSNLHVIGDCKRHADCHHAFHIVGKAHHTIINNNIMQDFNAMIKVNGVGRNFPDYGRAIENTFFNSSARNTVEPVTPFDLMQANEWQVSNNFFYDIQKSAGDKVSYAAFFKGGSSNGIFERNLIICSANLPNKYTALGLSLGGGGSPMRYRRNNNKAEHLGGIIRHNIIMHCANDVGIYLNKAQGSRVEHNILYNTQGIDLRFLETDAYVANNIISGRIHIRDRAKLNNRNNLVVRRDFITGEDSLSDYFVAPEKGDFTFKSHIDIESLNKPTDNSVISTNEVISTDFCGKLPKYAYLGAYVGNYFCLEKLNLASKTMKRGNHAAPL